MSDIESLHQYGWGTNDGSTGPLALDSDSERIALDETANSDLSRSYASLTEDEVHNLAAILEDFAVGGDAISHWLGALIPHDCKLCIGDTYHLTLPLTTLQQILACHRTSPHFCFRPPYIPQANRLAR